MHHQNDYGSTIDYQGPQGQHPYNLGKKLNLGYQKQKGER